MWIFQNHNKYQKRVLVTFIEDTDFIVIKDDLYKKQTDINEDDDTLEHEIIKTMTKIIDRQSKTIDNLSQPKKATSLSAIYFINENQITDMSNILVPGNKTKAVGQLVPRNANGDALPITSIDAVSASYQSSDNSIATVGNSAGGAFEVTRNGNADGVVTVSYSATNAQGNPVSGSDEITFEPVGAPVEEATELTADYTIE